MKYKEENGKLVYQCAICKEYFDAADMYTTMVWMCKPCGRSRRSTPEAEKKKYEKYKKIDLLYPDRKASRKRVRQFIEQLKEKENNNDC